MTEPNARTEPHSPAGTSTQRGTSRAFSRRAVLTGASTAGIAVLVTGVGATSYRVFDNGVLDAGSGTPYEAWDNWRTDPSPLGAVAAAILAANPHNTQPWTFQTSAHRIDLFSDPTRMMQQVDPLNREHHVGLGCAVENLMLALSARGFGTDLTLSPDPANSSHLARVNLTAGSPSSSALYEAIGQRHSNRGPYRTKPVASSALQALSHQGADLPAASVHWITQASERVAFGAALIEATQAIIADEPQSREAFSWFRNNRDDINRHRDGLTLDGQGFDPLTLTLAKILPASSRQSGDDFWLTQTRDVHTATAAAYGVITVADTDDVRQRLAGGRLLQRIHLAATTQGLALQHMNQITERIDRDRQQGHASPFAARFRAATATSPAGQSQGLVAFRVGHAVRTARPSPRRTLSSVTS